MKLEGELPFFHSSMGREPDSLKVNDLDSTGYKLENQKVKEYDNSIPTDLKRNEGDLDLSSDDMDSEDSMSGPKIGFYDSTIDFKRVYGIEPISPASKHIDSFMKFSNEKKSVASPPSSPISGPPEQRDSLKNSVDVYMDKTVPECEPELVVCYKESNYHDVKDICVDEGVPTKDKVVFEMNVNDQSCYFFPSEENEDIELKKDNMGIVLNLSALQKSDQVSANHDQSKDLMHKDEAVMEKLSADMNNETLPGDKVQEEPGAFDDDNEQVCGEPELHSQSRESNDLLQVSGDPELRSQSRESNEIVEEAVLASPALASAVDESDRDTILLDSGNFIDMFDASAPAACEKEEWCRVGVCKCSEIQNIYNPVDGRSDGPSVTSHIRNSLGDSSFSAVGHGSSRITYSGPVPYSGSISLRSDSSTTSTRSFAFPILQSEWNSSPVRMAKAEKRQYQKRRGWRRGLLCCRF